MKLSWDYKVLMQNYFTKRELNIKIEFSVGTIKCCDYKKLGL